MQSVPSLKHMGAAALMHRFIRKHSLKHLSMQCLHQCCLKAFISYWMMDREPSCIRNSSPGHRSWSQHCYDDGPIHKILLKLYRVEAWSCYRNKPSSFHFLPDVCYHFTSRVCNDNLNQIRRTTSFFFSNKHPVPDPEKGTQTQEWWLY